jgi:archaeosine-15-forming tRNA-guanine transglycosylase
VEGHSSRLEQVEDRISEVKDKTEIKEDNRRNLKQLKSCGKNMQELSDSIKRPNLRIMGIEEGEEVQVKGIHNIFHKIIIENFPNIKEVLPIQIQEASTRTLNRLTKIEPPHGILALKQQTQRTEKEY